MTLLTDRVGCGQENDRILSALWIKGQTTLDLGCGNAPVTRHMKPCVMIDCDARDKSPENTILCDIRNAPSMFRLWSFGTVYMVDVIEHLHTHEGLKLLSELEALCQRIAIFTPLGEMWVTPESTNPHAHRSGWTEDQLAGLGYHTWVWPTFHRYPDGYVHGAIWAWKTLRDAPDITPDKLAKLANVQP